MAKKNTNTWIVYMHTVPKDITGYEYDKYYIGITCNSPQRRWQGKGNGYRNQVFYRAIQKYGWDNIQHEILAENLSKDDAQSMEVMLIWLYKANDRSHGYNCTIGGEGASGYHLNEEQRKKFMASHPRGESHPGSVKVVLLNTQQVFCSIQEASDHTHLYATQIRLSCQNKTVCSSKRDSNGNVFSFAYYDDFIQMTLDDIAAKIKQDTQNAHKQHLNVPIVCLNTEEVFRDYIDACNRYPTASKSGILTCLDPDARTKSSGRLESGERLVWVYYTDYLLMNDDEIRDKIMNGNTHPSVERKVPEIIVDLYDKKIYKSPKLCGQYNNIPLQSMYRLVKHKIKRSKYGLNRFLYFEECKDQICIDEFEYIES